MATQDKMTIDERHKYLRRMKTRYAGADPKERAQPFARDAGHHGAAPQEPIGLRNGTLAGKPRRKQRARGLVRASAM